MTGIELLCKLSGSCKREIDTNIHPHILSDIPKQVDITRKQAALIVHEFIKRVLNEPDEKDVTEARILRDLFDCRVCVQHIEQVFCKGIMRPMVDYETAKSSGIPMMFGGNTLLDEEEADSIVKRVFDISQREKKKL